MKKSILSTLFLALQIIPHALYTMQQLTEEEKKFFTAFFDKNTEELKKLIKKNKNVLKFKLSIPKEIQLENKEKIHMVSIITPLILAISEGLVDIATFLINSGVDINEPTQEVLLKSPHTVLKNEYPLGVSIFMTEKYENLFSITEKLISKKANVNATNAEGASPLMIAAGLGQKKTVNLLLNNNADVTLKLTAPLITQDDSGELIIFKDGSNALQIAQQVQARTEDKNEKKEYEEIIILLKNAQEKTKPTTKESDLLKTVTQLEKSLSSLQTKLQKK